jgi:DUF2971 family protein
VNKVPIPAPIPDFSAIAAITGLSVDQLRLATLMMPHAASRQARVYSEKSRFVYYTNAETAVSIIRNREVWLRKVACMNDLSEVRYGLDLLYQACSADFFRERLRKVLGEIDETFIKDIENLWSGWEPHLYSDTYVLCLSEHDDCEDMLGRLSMWRAYGRNCGVALVMNTGPFASTRPEFGATTSPVAYFTKDEFMKEFSTVLDNMESNVEFLKSVSRDDMIAMLFNVLRFAALATKHPAFREEREWRVIHSPRMYQSKYIQQEIVVINGIPQPICKIALKDIPEVGMVGAEIPSLLDRLIIGPTDFGFATWEAFVELLRAKGVPEPEKKVVLSNIPLRPS